MKNLVSKSVLFDTRHQVLLFVISMVSANAAFAQATGGGPPAFLQAVPFVFAFGILIYMQSRSAMKKQKLQKSFHEALKRGDRVVTASGILGSVEGLTDTFITLEIANDVKIKILKSQIAGFQDEVKS